jgi:hypothetical protein
LITSSEVDLVLPDAIVASRDPAQHTKRDRSTRWHQTHAVKRPVKAHAADEGVRQRVLTKGALDRAAWLRRSDACLPSHEKVASMTTWSAPDHELAHIRYTVDRPWAVSVVDYPDSATQPASGSRDEVRLSEEG